MRTTIIHHSQCFTHHWYRLVALVAFFILRCSFSTYEAKAQEITDGEAFYIYRNDGDFDGFFVDQVEEIRYSKIDLNGVEHDDYVIQEVQTVDSLYRIPLAAIDSVSFVQPEIRFNKAVRHMDQLGMTQYVESVSGMVLIFDAALPVALRPRVGDMLLGFTGVLEENGFGGRVTKITEMNGNALRVECEKPEKLGDIFERFVTIEEVGVDEETHQQRRRMAGYRQMQTALRGKPVMVHEVGGGSLSLLNLNMNLRVPILPELTYSEELGIQMFCNMEGNFNLEMKLCMVYQIDDKNFFAKAMLSEDFGLQAGIDIGFLGSYTKSILPFNPFAIKFPVVLPLFEVRPVPDLVIKVDGKIKLGFRFPRIGNTWRQTFTIDLAQPDHITCTDNSKDRASLFPSLSELWTDLTENASLTGSVQLGVRIQAGIFTNGWFDWLFNAGMGVNIVAGPKLEGAINEDYSHTSDPFSDGFYINRNNRIALNLFSVDYEAFGNVEIGALKLKYTFGDGSFQFVPPIEAYMFPTITMKDALYDADTHQVKARLETDQRRVFWPSEIGLGLLNADMSNILNNAYSKKIDFGDYGPNSFSTTFPTNKLKPGFYNVAPVIKSNGKENPIRSQAVSVTIPAKLELGKEGKDYVTVGSGASEGIMEFVANVKDIVAYVNSPNQGETVEWAKVSISPGSDNSESRTLEYKVAENPTPFERRCEVNVVAYINETPVAEDVLCIVQAPHYPPFKGVGIHVELPGKMDIEEESYEHYNGRSPSHNNISYDWNPHIKLFSAGPDSGTYSNLSCKYHDDGSFTVSGTYNNNFSDEWTGTWALDFSMKMAYVLDVENENNRYPLHLLEVSITETEDISSTRHTEGEGNETIIDKESATGTFVWKGDILGYAEAGGIYFDNDIDGSVHKSYSCSYENHWSSTDNWDTGNRWIKVDRTFTPNLSMMPKDIIIYLYFEQ